MSTAVDAASRVLRERNAPMLKLVLVLTGVFQPLMLGYAFVGPQAASLDPVAVWLAIINTGFVWTCYLVVLRGRTRLAASLFVAGTLALLTVAYLRWGLRLQLAHQATQIVPVLVCGLLLHRRALWLTAGWLILIVCAGAWQDAARALFHPEALYFAISGALASAFAFLVIAIFLDRAVSALRDSLEMAVRRANELGRSRDRLELEIAEKIRSQAQLVHAQKMEAVGRLASGLAHDFNHLLALILGYADRGLHATTVAETHRALAGVEAAGRRATATSKKLLGFSRQDVAHVEEFDAVLALREMEPVLKQLFNHRARVHLTLPEHAVRIRFDRAQLELVVLNLAANADHAMPDGGRFSLSGCVGAGGQFELRFTDSGHGVPEAVRARIFEPFFTTRPKELGTGLGLAVSADLLRDQGGTLSLENTSPAGSTFLITLPVIAETQA
ncbi:C4-dicarboxylate-specific signal transduction histidine kinase [Luteimonas sp. 3794]|nr:C4-dicarboxylate-specific signal transduction histidine kinase [Luteimonas sp. 3794]